MKTKTKALALFLSAVLLVVTTVFTTMAYLTSKTEAVKNTFTVGDVVITLDEFDYDSDEVDADNKTTKDKNVRDEVNEYHLLPAGKYTKDPTVHIETGSEDCYVRMLVTVTDYDKLKTAFPVADYSTYWADEVFLLQKLVDWNTAWKSVGVKIIENDDNTKTAVYEFRYTDTYVDVSALDTKGATYEDYSDLPALFTEITIPSTMTNGQIAALNGVTIDVEAHAIQASGFVATDGKTAEQVAWEAFDAQVGTD